MPPESPIDEIKRRLSVEQVVGEYVTLKKAGINFKGLCPFHHERTPSFFVSTDRQMWHCFGCGEGGDIFTFVMRMEGLEFGDALRLLANKAGVELKKQTPEMVQARTRRSQLADLVELAARYYNYVLMKTATGEVARKYLSSRGIDGKIATDWQLGYAPNQWDALLKYLQSKGHKEKDIVDAGLAIKKETGSGVYDRFRNRIIFPIATTQGEVTGFSGRAMPGEDKEGAKYINTPQTILFDKSTSLYGIDKARQAIRQKQLAIIVEGQMDVISSHRVGLANTVASSGTALTEQQIEILKRFTETVALAFDMDAAGSTATRRGVELAITQGLNVRVVTLPAGKDPDELARKDPSALKKAVETAKPVIDFYFSKILGTLNANDVTDKKKASKELLPLLVLIPDKIEQSLEAPPDP